MIDSPLPFFDQRCANIDMLVLHSIAYAAKDGIERLRQCQVSPHYIVDYNGEIYRCVDESKRAWHAGAGYWRGITDINSHSIGIEVCNQSLGQTAFHKKQIAALIPLCQEIVARYRIKPQMIVGHSDIAPQRKPDPGKCFPWAELSAAGIGIWFGSRFTEETDIIKMLREIGYQTEREEAAIYAFCRRFLPDKINRQSVKEAEQHPYPENCATLFTDNDVLRTVQNIYMQYRFYEQSL